MDGREGELRKSRPLDRLVIIGRHPFFAGLPGDVRQRLVDYTRSKRYDAGSAIFSKGDPGSALFFVCEGTVKLSAQSQDGKDAVFNLAKEGDFFGEIALLDGLPRTANASAFTNCELLVVERRDLVPILEDHPALMWQLIQLLCARLRKTSEQVENLMFIDLAGRLARTLLELSSLSKSPGHIFVAQREIAQIAGVSREMANKQLRRWERDSLIKLARKEIIVLRPEELSRAVWVSYPPLTGQHESPARTSAAAAT